jgi:glycosyltransferase involved in cell wall biosynthesis
MDTILIIVPIYNVEKFLNRCLDSIINQTYKNIKCILVDDGSTDSSGTICDNYAKKDSRITVLHKKNGGLSSARNFALDYHSKNNANEKYLMFVDSDDWIADNAVEILVNDMITSNSDIICFNYIAVYKNNKHVFMNTTKDCNYTTIQIKEKLLYDYWLNFVWDKFYKIELFDSTRFCEHLNFEDSEIMPQILLKAKKISCIKDGLYYYNRVNTSSIINNYINSKDFFGIHCAWISHLHAAHILKMPKLINYCNKKAYLFAIKAFTVSTIDNRISIENQNELLCYFEKNRHISFKTKILYLFCVKFSLTSKIWAYIIIIFNNIKLFFRNMPFIYFVWMKYKNNQ